MVAVRKIISHISSKLSTKTLHKCDHTSHHLLTTTASKKKSLTNKITFRKKLSNIFNWNALVNCKDDFLNTLKKPQHKLIFNHLSEIKMPLHYNEKGKTVYHKDLKWQIIWFYKIKCQSRSTVQQQYCQMS